MTVADRVVSSDARATEEDRLIQSLRPETLEQFVGQSPIKERLQIAIGAAVIEDRTIDHVLLTGSKGLGKSSLAKIIAKTTGGELHEVLGPSMKDPADINGLLTNLEEGDVLFIDEIHGLDSKLCEYLYTAMEDFQIHYVLGSGRDAQTYTLDIAPFTLVGATTRKGSVPSPMLDRFGIQLALQFYDTDSLATIVKRSALLMELRIDDQAAASIARRARGTPRIANRLLKRVRDYVVVNFEDCISIDTVERSMAIEGIDRNGLDELDRQYLQILFTVYGGGPAGVGAIGSSMQEDAKTLVESVEPELLRNGLILRETRGRKLTLKGMQAIRA